MHSPRVTHVGATQIWLVVSSFTLSHVPDGEGGTFRFTYADLIGLTIGALYDPATWPDLADALQLLDTLDDPAAAAASVHSLRVQLGANQEKYPNFVEGFPGVACSDSDNPSDRSRLEQGRR